MKSGARYGSLLAGRMLAFIAFKRMQGHAYDEGAARLRRFDTFLLAISSRAETLDSALIERYRSSLGDLALRTQAGELSTLRQFSLYLHALDPRCMVVPLRLVRRQARPIRFHPLSPEQVGMLMHVAGDLPLRDRLVAEAMRFLIGLLYSTGLRISEALALDEADVDPGQATLFVRKGKFRKQRLVVMSPSTRQAVLAWIDRRAPYVQGGPAAPLLVAGWNRRLNRRQATWLFRRTCHQAGLEAHPPPRLHDLRHNYACRCLERWRESGSDIESLLPVLTNAMGHVDFPATQVYVHLNAAALGQAAAKFRIHANPVLES